jgi:DNA-binding NarL/FixJ family response regulator
MRVLIVDNIIEIVHFLDELIRSRFDSAQTLYAQNPVEAIRKYDQFNPQFVLLDLKLGDENGLAVLRHIRSKNSESKVIMVSNYNDAVHRNICSVLGADYFIDKSNEFDRIPEIISEYISTRAENVKYNKAKS